MKMLTNCTIAAIAMVLFFQSAANAQCTVKIIGTPSVGSPLRAGFQGSTSLQVLIWQLNGTTVYNAYKAEFNKRGVTVAGGNGYGNAANQLAAPADVYADSDGNVYVLDGYNSRVQKWAPGATSGITVAGGNGIGGAPGQLYLPQGFFIDQSGNIFIADLYNNRVQKWTPGASAGITVAGGNSYGSGSNQLNVPHDVYASADGTLYITDGDNNRVQKWAPGALSGTTVAGGNGPGLSMNQLNSPFSVFLDTTGNLYISDRANDRIQMWSPGAAAGVTIAGFSEGYDSTQLNDPRGVFVNKDGVVYVADYSNNRIQKFIPGMNYGITVVGDLKAGKSAYKFSNPSGIYISQRGDLYVTDEGNNRVQKFAALNTINTKYTPKAPGTYRVIAIFDNGCRDTSDAVIVPETQVAYYTGNTEKLNMGITGTGYSLSPNPATTFSNFSFTAKANENYSVQVTDIAGRVIRQLRVKAAAGNNSVKVDVSYFAAGVYIVNLKSESGMLKSFKLFKQ